MEAGEFGGVGGLSFQGKAVALFGDAAFQAGAPPGAEDCAELEDEQQEDKARPGHFDDEIAAEKEGENEELDQDEVAFVFGPHGRKHIVASATGLANSGR